MWIVILRPSLLIASYLLKLFKIEIVEELFEVTNDSRKVE
jgi:hypothetical protein